MEKELTLKITSEMQASLYAVEIDYEENTVIPTFQITVFIHGKRVSSSFSDFDLEFEDENMADDVFNILHDNLGKSLEEISKILNDR